MKKTFKKPWLLLLLSTFFLLTNCAEEYDVPISLDTAAIKHRILTGIEAREKKDELVAHLQKPGGLGMANLSKHFAGDSKFRKLADVQGYIDYSEVYEVKYKNGDANYTYMLNDPKSTELVFYNIVFKKRGSYSKSVVIKYEMDPLFAQDYQEGKSGLENFKGIISFEILDVDAGFDCGDEPNIAIPVSGGSGPGNSGGSGGSGGGSGSGGSGGGSGGGGGTGGSGGLGGSGGSGYYYNQDLVNAKFMALKVEAAQNTDPDNDWWWTKVHKSPRNLRTGAVDPALVDPSSPCGGEEEIGIIEPRPIADQKNCVELTAKSQNATLQAKMAELKGKAASQNFESAYTLYQVATQGLAFSGEAVGTSSVPEVSLTLNQSSTQTPTNAIGFMHCHLDDGTTFKVFSFADIVALAQVAETSTRPTQELVIYLTTASGTFALKVNDEMALRNYLMRLQLLGLTYETAFAKYVDKNKSLDDQTLGLLNFMRKEFPDTSLGIDLYQQDADGSWEKLELNSSGKQIKRKKC